MSGALDLADPGDVDNGGPAPIPPERMLPIRPRLSQPRDQGLNEPKLVTDEQPPEKPLLSQEIVHRIARWLAMKNLADEMSDEDIGLLGSQAKREYELDDTSRNEWKTKYQQWMDLAMQIAKPKTYPWPDACYSLDTDVLTADGWKPVADVRIGEMVLSRGPDRRAAYYPVTKTFRHHALSLVHFHGKSIDLLVTPNHRMVVESKYGKRKKQHFIEAQRFLDEKLAWRYIPLTAEREGADPDTIHGLPARAYLRFLGWYISEGWRFAPQSNRHVLKDGTLRDYGPTTSSFGIAQSPMANAAKHRQLREDIEACGFTWSAVPHGFIVHARSMPKAVKEELAALGTAEWKHIPRHIFSLSSSLLRHLLDRLVAGDGCIRVRSGKQDAWQYHTTSRQLADDVQELCQLIGLRGTIATREAAVGGVIGGRSINAGLPCHTVHINRKDRIQVAKMERHLVREPQEVACVEVEPFHTLYVRRNGKALWCGNSNVIFPLITVAALQFNARAYPAIVQGRNVVRGTVIGDDRGVQATSAVVPPQAPPGGVGASGPAPVPGPGAPPPGNVMPGMGPAQPNALAQASAPPPPTPEPGQPVTDPQGNPIWLVKPGIKQQRADNIGRHMSWQLLKEQSEWEEQTDRLLLVTAVAGTMFRKTYYDPSKRRNVSETVDALRVVVNYKAKSFDDAPRVTEEIDVYPWDIETNIRSGLWRDVEYGQNHDTTEDEQAPVTFCEQQRRWDLDDDGYDEPVIVTFARDSGEVARVVPGFDEECIEATDKGDILRIEPFRIMTKYGFIPNPDGGVYDVGFGHLLYPLNEAINTTINQMFDAGHLANAGGGFIGGGMSINAGSVRFTVGEYKVINTPGRAARDNIIPLDFRGPNVVLFQLLQYLVEAAREIGSIKDILTGDLPGANVPGILGLAVIQQGLKVFNAIFKRIHRSLGKDFEKLFRLNRLYLPDLAGYRIGSEYFQIKREDYEAGAGVEPVSDPDMVTDAQQMAQANFLSQFLDDPHFDSREIRLRMMNAAAIAQIDKLLKDQAPPNAQIVAGMAQLDLEKRQLDLREQELNIRGEREQADLAIRRGKDKAIEIRELSQAILNLANARKADQEADQNWYALQLEHLRHQIDLLNVTSEMGGPGENPAAAAGIGGGAPGDSAGSPAAGGGGMAPPPGLAGGAPVPAGLPG